MNSMTVSYEGEDRCPNCGMPLHMAGIEREEVPETTDTESRMSLIDSLVLPIGVITALLFLTFPLSLPALYGIALLLMK
jgi:hypothetical protein